MATFDATVGGSAATSLATVAALDDAFAVRPASAWWAPLPTAEKESWAMIGTARLEQCAWRGARTSTLQALAWPRRGVTDRDGYAMSVDLIPLDVVRALAEVIASYYAASLAQVDARAANALAAFESVTVGPVSVTPASPDTAPVEDELPVSARRWVGYLLREGSMVGRVGR